MTDVAGYLRKMANDERKVDFDSAIRESSAMRNIGNIPHNLYAIANNTLRAGYKGALEHLTGQIPLTGERDDRGARGALDAAGAAGLGLGPFAGRALQGVASTAKPAGAFSLGNRMAESQKATDYNRSIGGEFQTRPIVKDGDQVGLIEYTVKQGRDGPEVMVHDIKSDAALGTRGVDPYDDRWSNQFGPAAIRQVARQIKEETGASLIGGARISGARRKANSNPITATVLRSQSQPASAVAVANSLREHTLNKDMFNEVVAKLQDGKLIDTDTLHKIANDYLGNDKQYKGRKEAIQDIVRRRSEDVQDHALEQAMNRVRP